jgi:hypothetical protein
VVRLQDLPRVEALAFVNSLRGWIPAALEMPAGGFFDSFFAGLDFGLT